MTNPDFFAIMIAIRVCFGYYAVFSAFPLKISQFSRRKQRGTGYFSDLVQRRRRQDNFIRKSCGLLGKALEKVLICDCDLESRCLDMVLGVEDQPLFNICDAVSGHCEVKDAICRHERVPNLSFMPAPAFYPEAVGSRSTDDIFTPSR